MENKKIIIGILILVILLVGFVFFFRANLEGDISNNNQEEVDMEINFNPDKSYFYKAGENGEQSFRRASEKIDQFKAGDFLAVVGFYESNMETFIEMHILDDNQNTVQENVISLNLTATEEEKNFDACCAQVPSNPGSYYLTIETEDGLTDFLLPFEVVEN